MDSFAKLLGKIKKRPSMFLGKPSIELLKVFMTGYMVCKSEPDVDTDFYSKFQTFIEQKYGIRDTEHHTTIIRSVTKSDEEAFYKYFELLDEFMTTQK